MDSHDFFVRKLAHERSYAFVAVFPAGLEDCMAAATWVDDHAEDYGGIVGRLAVAGQSAGGSLAAVVARKFRDDNRHRTAQLLLYPVIDSTGDYPSRHEYRDGYLTTVQDIAIGARVYLGDNPTLVTTQDIAPIRATAIGDNDTMMHTKNSYLLAERLPNAHLRVYPDSNHGFLNQYPELFADHVGTFLDAR